MIALLLSLTGPRAFAAPQASWILDGPRLCTFDANVSKPPAPCLQYHQEIAHKLQNNQAWHEYRWMWKDSKFEVQYVSAIGSLGISEFTIGEIRYRQVGSSRYTKSQAVSYSASREEVVIGIPGDGYRFAMMGAL